MQSRTLTLNLPDALYGRLQQRAREANRSLEAEILEVVASAVPLTDELPADLAEAVSPLSLLDDESLWRAARSHLAADAAEQLESLHLKESREGLTGSEADILAALVRQYERAMLVRAQAAALLKQRGHDVGELVVSP